jgi:hypothetical protein
MTFRLISLSTLAKVFSLIICTSLAIAEPIQIEHNNISSFQFDTMYFGQIPSHGMTLIELPGSLASPGESLISLYKNQSTSTSIGDVPIEPPSCMFWDNQLFSIGFSIVCSDDQSQQCFVEVLKELSKNYGLKRLSYQHQENVFGSHDRWEFLTDSETLLFASLTISMGKVVDNRIRFTDKFLVDQMGYSNNPQGYKQMQIWLDNSQKAVSANRDILSFINQRRSL